jgi:hypothetical protein
MKILIGTSLLSSIDGNVYSNHCALFYHLGRIGVERGWQFIHMAPTRMSIDRMRNEAAKLALQLECDYLIFIDDDMLLQVDTIEKLIDADKDIIMAHTIIRGYPFNPMCFLRTDTEDDADIKLVPHLDAFKDSVDGLTKTDAIGFAVVAIKTHLLKKLKAPWFITGPNGTEDIYFCIRCHQELEEPTKIYVHTGVPTAHKLEPEFVSQFNVEKLREFHKPEVPAVDTTIREDRGTEYHEAISNIAVSVGDELSFEDKV